MTAEPVQHKRFDFGTVFGDAGNVVSEPKREKKYYTPEEVEDIRKRATAAGEASALARAENAKAAAIRELAEAARAGLNGLTEAVQLHKAASVKLALVCAQRIAVEALERFPEAPLTAALDALGQEIERATRLVISVQDPDESLQAAATQAAEMSGFPGAISFRSKAALSKGGFEVAWSEGRAEYDPQAVFDALDQALVEALEAEILHSNRAHHDDGTE